PRCSIANIASSGYEPGRAGAGRSHRMRPILLDTDIGSNVDDMLALAFLLRSPTLHLEGITTVYGNTELRARIAGVVCRLAGRPDVPIVSGIATPLSGRQVFWAGS